MLNFIQRLFTGGGPIVQAAVAQNSSALLRLQRSAALETIRCRHQPTGTLEPALRYAQRARTESAGQEVTTADLEWGR